MLAFIVLFWKMQFGEVKKKIPFLELRATSTVVPSFNKVMYRGAELSIQKGSPCGLKDELGSYEVRKWEGIPVELCM